MKPLLEAAIVFALVYLVLETRKTAGSGCGCGCGSTSGCVSSGMIASVPTSNLVSAAQVASVNPINAPGAPPIAIPRPTSRYFSPYSLNVPTGTQKLTQLGSITTRPVYVG
jgi:hypothetical protein